MARATIRDWLRITANGIANNNAKRGINGGNPKLLNGGNSITLYQGRYEDSGQPRAIWHKVGASPLIILGALD